MSMFTNYENTPSSYIPNNTCKKNPYIGNYPPKKPFVVYNAKGEEVGYKWNYGDTIVLNFNISGLVYYSADSSTPFNESIATYMTSGNEKIVFRIYNFRYECIYKTEPEFVVNPDSITDAKDGSVGVKVLIYDTLADLLVKGRYYISMEIVGTHPNPAHDEDPSQPETIQVRHTIFKPDTCPITIW